MCNNAQIAASSVDGKIGNRICYFESGMAKKIELKQRILRDALYDLDGYYAGLKALLAHMVKMGLSSPERQSGIYFAKELDEIKSILKRA